MSQNCNRGHQNAFLAVLKKARTVSDITISIGCDGQDAITAMNEMVIKYLNGAEVVYKHADYRFMGSRVLDQFADFYVACFHLSVSLVILSTMLVAKDWLESVIIH